MKKIKRTLALLLCTIFLFLEVPTVASAASYPLATPALESSVTIPQGEEGLFRLMIMPEYHNEKYNVEVYNSSGKLIASASNTYYNSDGTVVKYVNLSIDTADLNMGVGTYTVKYWMSFYSMYEWHDAPRVYSYTLKVIPNICRGNHNLLIERYVGEPTCQEADTIRYYCSKCQYVCYKDGYGDHTYGSWSKSDDSKHKRTCTECGASESASHSWNAGTVTKQPNCSETGVKTYTCSICNGTKTETIAKTTDHVYGDWTQLDDSKHQHECTKCGTAQTANHSWNAGTVTKQPNCSETGVMTYTCSICNGTKTEDIAKTTDHVYGNWTKVNDNSHTHSCTLCGKTETVAHEWDSGKITVTPTLETTGIRVRSCKGCDATKTEVVPKRANGDLNGDQSIDNKDVEYLLWHTLFPDSYPLEIFADFDNNNVIDNKDVEYLLWHTLFPDSYPLYSK